MEHQVLARILEMPPGPPMSPESAAHADCAAHVTPAARAARVACAASAAHEKIHLEPQNHMAID